MNTEQTKSHAHRPALLVICILLFLFVGLPLFFFWLLMPSSSQLKRLEANVQQQYEGSISPSPPSDVIILGESDLDYLMNRGMSVFTEESEDIHFAGSDLVFNEDRMSLLVGVRAAMPWDRQKNDPVLTPFTAEVFLDVVNAEPSMLSVRLKKIKIGKLGIPVAALMKLQFLKDSLTNSLSFLPGTSRIDLQKSTAHINLNDAAEEWFPGWRWDVFSFHPKEMRLHFLLPEEELQNLKNLSAKLSGYMPLFHARVLPVLPSGSEELLKACEQLMSRIALTGTDQSTLDPLSGLYAVAKMYIDLWVTLPEQDQEHGCGDGGLDFWNRIQKLWKNLLPFLNLQVLRRSI